MQQAVYYGKKTLTIENPGIFAHQHPVLVRQFLQRAFRLASIRCIELNIESGSAKLHFDEPTSAAHTRQLADELAMESSATLDVPHLNFEARQRYQFTRLAGCITHLAVSRQKAGYLEITASELGVLDRATRKRLLQHLAHIPGIKHAKTSFTNRKLKLWFIDNTDSHLAHCLPLLESCLSPENLRQLTPIELPAVGFKAANVNFGLCTAGQFFFPALIPVACGVLVVTRLELFKEVGSELIQGKIGAPAFQTVVLACSVATAAPFASALAEWLGCYWQRSWRKQVSREANQLLLSLPTPQPLAPVSSAVLTEAIRTISLRLPHDTTLKAEARKRADKSVLPNLAIAGAAVATGGLHMASAVLHQDWISGPAVVSPTQFFVEMRSALESGVLLQTTRAIAGLAAVQMLVVHTDAITVLPATRQRVKTVVSVASGPLAWTSAHSAALRKLGYTLMLVSDQPETETRALAEELGFERILANMNEALIQDALSSLGNQGYSTAYLSAAGITEAVAASTLSIATAQAADASMADIRLLSSDAEALIKVCHMAKAHDKVIASASDRGVIPNLLCIAGAFTSALTGTTSTVIAHLGVMTVVSKQRQSLKKPG